jgi:two-component system sensor histidine kinase and response regulator WspE
MDQRLGPTPCIAAAALMEDGTPVLILDVPDMIAMARQTRSAERGTVEQADGPVKRILVVEDSITVREMERKLFESHGYAVDAAVDGLDGWNALSAGRYDLLVTDVDMPRMNGIVLVTKLRADSRFAGLPIIIVSYKDREEDREAGMKAGANYYMTKNSFHDDTVIRMVRKILGDAAVRR